LVRLCGNPDIGDVLFDCVGEKGAVLNGILGLARRGARVVMVGVLQAGSQIPRLPDAVQHELRLSGTTMYTPADYREMLDLMASGTIRVDGMITHRFPFDRVADVFGRLARKELKSFKIMLDME